MKIFDGSSAAQGSTIVVADWLAARQWEIVLSAPQLGGGARAWVTPPVITYAEWLERLWLEQGDDRPGLTSVQSGALWRRVIAESAESDRLIAHDGVAAWAADAWRRLLRFDIDPGRQRGRDDEPDYRALLSWCDRYRAALDDLSVVDQPDLERRLSSISRAADQAVRLDLAEDYPVRTRLLERLMGAGSTIEQLTTPPLASSTRAVRLADSADEIQTALRWARQRLAVAGQTRVAIVVADLRRRYDEIQGFVDAEFGGGPPTWSRGMPLRANAAVAAAVTALRLLTPAATYADFGRWLRSPFFTAGPAEHAERALLDVSLRTDLRAQAPFRPAYREGGLQDSVRRQAPSTADVLARALSLTDGSRRATPGRWARDCSAFLERLGWQIPRDTAIGRVWQSTLDNLAHLTPVLGEIPLAAALGELAILLERPMLAPLPLHGLHILDSVDEVGPGYDAVWLTGLTDTRWPEAARGNPLLPLALQRAHGMPDASPRAVAALAARRLARIVQRVPLVMASWPARTLDYETEPSPAIRGWPGPEVAPAAAPSATRTLPVRETLDDQPPPVAQATLPGGAGMLGRQARCPLRAFCEDRLRARPLEPIGFGMPRRLRGIAVHRAAERLLADLPAQIDLEVRRANVATVAGQVLREIFGSSRRLLQALYELELAQLCDVLTALLDAEGARQPFQVIAVEQSRTVQLDAWTIEVRVDRLDRLANGRIAVIDYKTGQNATSAGWFKSPLLDAQVPLYAIDTPEIGAAVIVRLRPAQTSYSGLWQDNALPGRCSSTWDGDWPKQIAHWRTELVSLAAEFARGDTRVFVAARDEAAGAYAPLTRIHEQLGLQRGTVTSW